MLNGKLKRFMSTGVAAALSLAMLAGCGGNSGKNEASPSTTPAGSDKPGVSAAVETYENGLPKNEEVTLKVGFFVGGYGREWFDYAVESFTAKYPNVKVDITASADMKTILSTKISAGNDNDMFDLFNTDPAGGIVGLAEAGKLEPMDDIWEYPLPDVPDKRSRIL